jgi:hypothetical protein
MHVGYVITEDRNRIKRQERWKREERKERFGEEDRKWRDREEANVIYYISV